KPSFFFKPLCVFLPSHLSSSNGRQCSPFRSSSSSHYRRAHFPSSQPPPSPKAETPTLFTAYLNSVSLNYMRCGCFIAPGRGSSLLRSLLWDVTASLPPRQSCCYFPALCRVSPSPRAPCHRELTLSHTLQAHSASPFIYHHLSGFYRHLMYFGCGISPKT
ncbi:hypothetical protein HN51_052307, partial [Arachis hypogaea]